MNLRLHHDAWAWLMIAIILLTFFYLDITRG